MAIMEKSPRWNVRNVCLVRKRSVMRARWISRLSLSAPRPQNRGPEVDNATDPTRHVGGRARDPRARLRVDRDGPACAAVRMHGPEISVGGDARERDVAALLERFAAYGASTGPLCASDLTLNMATRAHIGSGATRRRTSWRTRWCRPGRCREMVGPRIGGGRGHAVAAFADHLASEVRGGARLVLVRRPREGDELFDAIDAAHGSTPPRAAERLSSWSGS
jgi:hypothetical protein